MSKKEPVEYGNAIESQAAYVRGLVRNAEAVLLFERVADRMFEEDTEITGISIRMPTLDKGEYLMIVRAREGNRQIVAFHSAPTLFELVAGTVQRLQNKSLKWKDDEYAGK
jgi:hypothetical protein